MQTHYHTRTVTNAYEGPRNTNSQLYIYIYIYITANEEHVSFHTIMIAINYSERIFMPNSTQKINLCIKVLSEYFLSGSEMMHESFRTLGLQQIK